MTETFSLKISTAGGRLREDSRELPLDGGGPCGSMPVHVTVEKASRLVVFRVTGDPDIREMIESVERALADPRYQSGYNFLREISLEVVLSLKVTPLI